MVPYESKTTSLDRNCNSVSSDNCVSFSILVLFRQCSSDDTLSLRNSLSFSYQFAFSDRNFNAYPVPRRQHSDTNSDCYERSYN